MQLILLMLVVVLGTTRASPPSLTCADTARQPLLPISNCTFDSDGVDCYYKSNKLVFLENETIFTVLEEAPVTANHNSSITFCLGLRYMLRVNNVKSRFIFTQRVVHFNGSKTVGLMTVDSQCWEHNRSSLCLRNVTILEDVWTLGVFQNTPGEEAFWNFRSPLFSASTGWFLQLQLASFQFAYSNIDCKWLQNLQNTSIQYLHLNGGAGNGVLLLKDMPDIRTITVAGGSVKSLHFDSFIGTPKLENLGLSLTAISGISKQVVRRIPNLKKLELVYNAENFFISKSKLSVFQSLEYLSIYRMKMDSISANLPIFPKLRVLKLMKCGLSSLEDDAFKNYPALECILLNLNNIKYMNEKAFYSLRNLKQLSLANNGLEQWPIIHSCNMEVLILNSNNLSSLYNLGSINTTIKTLGISFNSISQWDDDKIFSYNFNNKSKLNMSSTQSDLVQSTNDINSEIIHGYKEESLLTSTTKWVDKIDLRSNSITVISKAMAQSFDGIREIKLARNPFDCSDCNFPEFQHWLNTTRTKVDDLVCASPFEKRDVPIPDIDFNNDFCQERGYSSWIILGIPFGIIFSAIFFAIILVNTYKSEITYMLYLYKIKKHSKDSSVARYKNCIYDAFVCYSGTNQRFAWKTLAPLLENCPERYKLCLHDRDFRLGSRISDNIVNSIEYSRKTIIILSKDFVTSKWCKWELEMANHKTFNDSKDFLILIQVEPLDREAVPLYLKYFMATRTFLEWPQEDSECVREEVYQRLKQALGESIFQKTSEEAPLLPAVSTTF